MSETITETKTQTTETTPIDNRLIGAKIGSSIGFIIALGYAFKVKSGFLKGWGYTILGSMALGGLGYGIGMAVKKKENV
tara:strand:- start:653 stop:889 length:237 start_codon:yes stop_codon:yes gene_type:complete